MERPSKAVRRLSLLVGIVAGEAYSIYATFIAHALTPVTVYEVDRYTHRRLSSGQIGDIEEIFNWASLVPVLVLSLIVSALTWYVICLTASCAHQFRRQTVARTDEIHTYPPTRAAADNRIAAAMTISGMLLAAPFLLAGCSAASTQYKSRPFFLAEEEVATHGRKAWYDRVVEIEPGHAEFTVAADYQQAPPSKIAVLPFTDLGEGEFVVDKLPLLPRNDQERARWGWRHANYVRRAFAGEVATREFTLIPLLAIDAVLAERGITDFNRLSAVTPIEIGSWLHADALVYGEVVDYEAYYGLLIAAWRVTARIRMVSTSDSHELFSCTDTRYSTDVTPAIDPIDIVISSVLNVIELRDITLARAEHEVGSEIVLRLPVAERNVSDFKREALEQEGSL
jgi:hypothetical protein